MSTSERLDHFRVQALLAQLERLAVRERELYAELREILKPDKATATFLERFGGTRGPTQT